jgi:hypothetical protein
MPRVRTYVTGFVLLAMLATAVAGCAPDRPEPAEESPPPGVSVSLEQWRSDEAEHHLEVSVRNTSDTPVHFARVQLVTESFRTLPPHPVNTTLRRTPRTDLRIPYGEAICPPDAIPPVRPAAVVADLRVGDGPERTVRFALPHPDPLLARLVREECGAHLLRRKVAVSFGASWTPRRVDGKEVMVGTLDLARSTGDERIEIIEIGETTHFTLRPAEGAARPVAVLPPGTQRLELPVELRPSRCDPHAFAEAKKAFLFPVRASIGGADPLWLIASPPKEAQTMLTDYARRACGLPGS